MATLGVYFLYRGWRRGFLTSLFGPMSFIFGILLGWGYFSLTKDILGTLLIAVFSPFLIRILLFFGLKFIRNKQEKPGPPLLPSQLAGAAVNLCFGLINALLLLILLLLVPDTSTNFSAVRDDIHNSQTYRLIEPALAKFFFQEKSPKADPILIQPIVNTQLAESLQRDPEYQTLVNNAKLKTILDDKELVEQVNHKEFAKLLTNPKILQIAQDQELLKNLLAVYAKILPCVISLILSIFPFS